MEIPFLKLFKKDFWLVCCLSQLLFTAWGDHDVKLKSPTLYLMHNPEENAVNTGQIPIQIKWKQASLFGSSRQLPNRSNNENILEMVL